MDFQKSDQGQRDFQPREMIKGDWACAECGAKITELPFQPSPDRPIYCRDCHQKRKAQFRR
jgi:CxxC-x17-CxxC domain-containing protein